MSLSDDRPTTRTQSIVLHRIMTPAKAAAYKRNRNDYLGYNPGRDAVDGALRASAADLAYETLSLKNFVYAGERHVQSQYSLDVDYAAAVEGFEELATRLEELATRARTLAAVAAMRAEDDLADADLHRISDALSGR